LSDLENALVTSIRSYRQAEHFDVFLTVNPLRPLSAVIMKD
jgi:hypothetical protein